MSAFNLVRRAPQCPLCRGEMKPEEQTIPLFGQKVWKCEQGHILIDPKGDRTQEVQP